MASPEAERRLTAVFVTDVVGYSRLMGDDHDATVRTLAEYRTVFSDYIQQHKGRVVNAPGDSILAELGSVVDAVDCAVKIQRELAERNEKLPDHRRMHFRIGVNLGDVLVIAGELFGDGVNIAARLEGLAEPGGICISRTVYDQVKSRLSLECEYLGEQKVRNISEPVRAYRVGKEAEKSKSAGSPPAAEPSAQKPSEPCLAVLPFENVSGDPEQDYFSDGITTDIITDLVKISGLFLIDRNSTFTYKGKQVTVQQVGKDLGARYVLKGSVRKAGDQVRISAQLIDAETGDHLWADRFDRKLDDVFVVQDEITNEIVTALHVTLVGGEAARVFRQSIRNSEARDVYYRGMHLLYSNLKENIPQALEKFEEVIRLEPEASYGYVPMSFAHFISARNGWSASPEQSLERGEEAARKAVSLGDTTGVAQLVLGNIHLFKGEHEQAVAESEKSATLRHSCPATYALRANVMNYTGNPEAAIDLANVAIRLTPAAPNMYMFLNILGAAYHLSGQEEEAISASQKAAGHNSKFVDAHVIMAAAYSALDRADEAKGEVREIQKINPRFSLKEYAQQQPYKDRKVKQKLIEQLRKAGLPD